MSSFELTREFHHAIGHPVATVPGSIDPERLLLRLRLIGAEFTELVMALTGSSGDDADIEVAKDRTQLWIDGLFETRDEPVDLVEVARQIADLHIVVSGTALEFGIPEPAVIEEVHRANLRKVGGPTRDDGKQMRPEGWRPPDVEGVLRGEIKGQDPLWPVH